MHQTFALSLQRFQVPRRLYSFCADTLICFLNSVDFELLNLLVEDSLFLIVRICEHILLMLLLDDDRVEVHVVTSYAEVSSIITLMHDTLLRLLTCAQLDRLLLIDSFMTR